MAHATPFLDDRKSYSNNKTGGFVRNIVSDFSADMESLLLDSDFDRIGCLETDSEEFWMYGDLGALPKDHR